MTLRNSLFWKDVHVFCVFRLTENMRLLAQVAYMLPDEEADAHAFAT
jgi:hypothetical protein